MRRKTAGVPAATPTTAQSLGSLIKSARDIMRKDKGLNGDLDRLPMLTWVMFLKFLDDLEVQREQEAGLAKTKFRPAIETPYRWRDWATNPQGMTGDELLAFINQDQAIRPNGKRGPGLFAYLRGLTSANGDDRRDVIATVFRGVDNRMKSGYLLRDVVNKVAGIHFTSSDELHTLGALYESMLREMRDAAGDSGEFYTPRPVVRFMVQVTDPRLGETVLDPASGTGGFLVESFNHLSAQVKKVQDRKILQEGSLFGFEAKPLPYLLGQMNLLLHGLDSPQIDPGNALRFKLTEIGEKDRVDVIVTNPPFGGEEEKGVQGNFPEDRQTSETALLFLQLIMRKLRKRNTPAGRPARAAVVVPNGTLFGDGVCARIKEELLTEFNLHTIVRLPNGVFAPGAADEAQPAGAPPKVTVIKAGDEPKIRLAVDVLEPGTKLVLVVDKQLIQGPLPTMDYTLEVVEDKKDDKDKGGKAKAGASAQPAPSAPAGGRPILLKVKKAELDSKQPGKLPEGAAKVIAKLSGSRITAVLTPAGSLAGVELRVPDEAKDVAPVATALVEALELFFSPMPSEPVGVGGSWIASDRTRINAFAVTLEPKGGLPQPSGQMYLLGSI